MWLIDSPMFGDRAALERDLAEARRMPEDAEGRSELIAALERQIDRRDRILEKLDDPAWRARMARVRADRRQAVRGGRGLRGFLDEERGPQRPQERP